MADLGPLGESIASSSFQTIQQAIGSREGYAKPNRYEIEVYFPSTIKPLIDNSLESKDDWLGTASKWISQGGNDTLRKLTFRCDEISFPGRNLRSVPTMAIDYGPAREIVQGATYGEISLSFYASSDLKERKVFEVWQEYIYGQKGKSQVDKYAIEYYNNYIGQFRVYALNEQNERTYGVRMEECYPKTVNAITLGHGQQNAVTKVTISLVYREWIAENIQSAGALERIGKGLVGNALGVVGNVATGSLPNVFKL